MPSCAGFFCISVSESSPCESLLDAKWLHFFALPFEVFIQGDEKKSRHHRSVNALVERLHSGITVNPGTRQYVQLHRSANRTVLIRTLP